MAAQASAHFLHAAAHELQQLSPEHLLQASAQALQISAQSLRIAFAKADPLASNLAHNAQISAQSRHSATQF
jgi:hypothetical protein